MNHITEQHETVDFRDRIIFPTSADPMHFGHLRTWQMARAQFGAPVTLVIVNNDAKQDQYLFSIDERRAMAEKYKAMAPELADCEIVVVADKPSIERMLKECTAIVRKDRGEHDREETGAIMVRYDLPDWEEKTAFFKVDEQLSSFELKRRVDKGSDASSIALQDVIDATRKKIK